MAREDARVARFLADPANWAKVPAAKAPVAHE